MKKIISITLIAITLMVLCTACDPTPSKKAKDKYPVEITTYEEFTAVVGEMGGSECIYSLHLYLRCSDDETYMG